MLRRVVILGTTGSGKSTLASKLAERIGAEHIELDAFYHGPHWKPRAPDEFAADIAGVLERPNWVVDGNYIERVSGTLWPHAQVVVWLDIPLRVILPRIARRTVRRVLFRVELWNGNRERWSTLFGPRSLIKWAVRSSRRDQAELPRLLAELERSGVRVVRLTSRAAVDRWLDAQTH